jgi:hypothetical protein
VKGSYFLNITNQKCKELQGVQVVVIEGDPCVAKTYKLKKCIAFTDQSDFFIKLDSLNSGEVYLVNIDGFLGDQCEFEINFSTASKGIPIEESRLSDIAMNLTETDSVVQIKWSIPDSLQYSIGEFEITRKRKLDKKAVALAKPMIYNAYGEPRKSHALFDTLHQTGEYTYKVYARVDNEIFFLGQKSISYSRLQKSHSPVVLKSKKRQIEYYLKKDSYVRITVLDSSGNELFSVNKESVQGRNTVLIDFAPFGAEGIYDFKVMVSNKYIHEEYPIKIEPSLLGVEK